MGRVIEEDAPVPAEAAGSAPGTPRSEPSFRDFVRDLTRSWAPRFPRVGRLVHPDEFPAEHPEESWGWDIGGRRAWMAHEGRTVTRDLTCLNEGCRALERVRVHHPERAPEAFAVAWQAAAYGERMRAHRRDGCPGGCGVDGWFEVCSVGRTLRAALDAQISALLALAARG